MQRSQTEPTSFRAEEFHHQQSLLVDDGRPPIQVVNGGISSSHHHQYHMEPDKDAIVRNIASFLTISDAASFMSRSPSAEGMSRVDSSWAVGVDMDEPGGYDSEANTSWEQQLNAPQTPAFISVSPGEFEQQEHGNAAAYHLQEEEGDGNEDNYDDIEMEEILWERRRRLVQQRLAAAVYSHPGSVRSFCMQAYQSAKDIMRERQAHHPLHHQQPSDLETIEEPDIGDMTMMQYPQKRRRKRKRLLAAVAEMILHNVPLSVLIDVLETTGEVSFDTTLASFMVAGKTLDALIHGVFRLLGSIWHGVVNLNPFQLLEAIVSFQFNAMGKTTEVLASGIQSVATGVGSASSLALHRLSAANLSVATRVTDASVRHGDSNGLLRTRSTGTALNQKLLKKLSAMNDAARVVRYMESEDNTGGLTKHARSKVQRMMHYEVSLRPFVATVRQPNRRRNNGSPDGGSPLQPPSSVAAIGLSGNQQLDNSPSGSSFSPTSHHSVSSDGSTTSASENPSTSPFMYTPQSFPATPQTRQLVMARGGRFADDVIFLARDRLRLHDSLESENERTREMAKLLREGKRLAVFNARDTSNGIELTCGQHIATKAGTMLYCTTRSMVPVLRNCLVYFEMTVLPRSFGNMALQPSMTTLSLGLSTEEMPANVLVGAWQGSCGLCTTGQIFAGGEWCAPSDPTVAAYRDGATIGCLVYLDDSSAEDTWEGVLVNSTITFNVNGFLVSPVLSSSIGVAAAAASATSPGMGMPSDDVSGHMKPPTEDEDAASSATMGMPLDDEDDEIKQSPPVTNVSANSQPGGESPSELGSSAPYAAVTASTVPPTTKPGNKKVRSHLVPSTSSAQSLLRADRPPITLSIKVPAAEELYPTVTLHSPATSVMCRFSAEDIVASSKETIGAPEHATVYAVDGSVIFV